MRLADHEASSAEDSFEWMEYLAVRDSSNNERLRRTWMMCSYGTLFLGQKHLRGGWSVEMVHAIWLVFACVRWHESERFRILCLMIVMKIFSSANSERGIVG